jgi:8-oxo-dGTP pyrophosphatase MutT (NUDIX family)
MKWTVHGRWPVYQSPWVNVWLDDVQTPDGRRFQHHVLRMPRRSITAVVVNDDDQVLLIWRHRFITDAWGWEIPAGWTDGDESKIDAAAREVEEETGWRPAPLAELISYNALSGISDMRFTAYLAHGATHISEPADPSESSRVDWLPLADIPRLISETLISDGPTLTALAYYLATRR